MPKEIKAILDFDGTLTDENKQADELAVVSKAMLAQEILHVDPAEIDYLYDQTKENILKSPHLHLWQVNDLPACYAYEGAYLLNTVILQQILQNNPHFLNAISHSFPADKLDSITKCVNHLFHEGSLHVSPHFLDGSKQLLLDLLDHGQIEPVILTNSETRKISKNLAQIDIGEKGTNHSFSYEIEILGDTKQYYLDPNWNHHFPHPLHGPIQVLPINDLFSVDLRRPIYHQALTKEIAKGYTDIAVAADGFSLAGSLPLTMDLHFFLLTTDYTPDWAKDYVSQHPKGKVANDLSELKQAILSLEK